MAEVKIQGMAKIGGKEYPVKRVDGFVTEFHELFIQATVSQLRILAYTLKDYLIDKLLAYSDNPGKRVLFRQGQDEEATEPREQFPDEPELTRPVDRILPLPPRDTDEPLVDRKPFYFPPLSREYLQRKMREGLDPRVLMASGEYLRGIVVRKRYDRRGGTYYVVTLANRKHSTAGIRLGQLAVIHEYGTREYSAPLFGDKNHLVKISMPPRPHWRPAFKVMQWEFESVGQKAHNKALKSMLQKLR